MDSRTYLSKYSAIDRALVLAALREDKIPTWLPSDLKSDIETWSKESSDVATDCVVSV